jgi:hypothetical protein
MRRIAVLLALLCATNASAFTLQTRGGGLTFVICDDVVYTSCVKGTSPVCRGRPLGVFVLTCPVTNPVWSLQISGCPTHKVSTITPGNYSFAC